MEKDYGRHGLKINRNKTIYLMLYGNGNLDGNSDINLHGENLEKRVSTFKYIGATLAENGDWMRIWRIR